MKKLLLLIALLIVSKTFAQNNSKFAFQKSRYELALSYYKKADFKKAIDLFYIASKIKPENEIGQESIRKVDSLKDILREDILTQVLGTWKMMGDKPIWAVNNSTNDTQKDFDQLVEINQTEILFFDKNNKTQERKLIKTEKLVYYNENPNALFSAIILSDGTIWNCILNENADELHIINIGKKDQNGTENIDSNNLEQFYAKVK